MADFTGVAVLTEASKYKENETSKSSDKDFPQSEIMATGFPQSENAVQFLMARDGTNDLFVIRKARTFSGYTEVHIYTGETHYRDVSEESTVLHETDDSWTFALGNKRDLFAIRKSDSSRNQSQLHVLTSTSKYKKFGHRSSILPHDHKLGHDYEFLLDSKDNLWVIKKQQTSMMEIRILSAADGYKTVLETLEATGVPCTDMTWSFLGVDSNEDVWVVDKKERKLYRLTKISQYKKKEELKLDSAKLEVGVFDRRCSFAVAPNTTENSPTFDLYVFKTSRTSSGNVRFHVVDKPFYHQNPRLDVVRDHGDINCLTTGDQNAFSWITGSTIPVPKRPTGENGKGLPVQESYLRIVTKIPTWTLNQGKKEVTPYTQVSFFSQSYRFQGPGHTMVTRWEASGGDSCDFLFAEDTMDMYVIKKRNCESKKVEVYHLTWQSEYRNITLVGSTPLDAGEVDHTWTFLLANDLELICIQKSGTDSGKTECWRLPHPYSSWSPETDRTTGLDETDDSWDFLLAPNKDLYAIHKYEPGTASPGSTKIKVLSAGSGWKEIDHEFKTKLPQTDYNYSFCLTTDKDLVAVQKSRFPFSADMASI